MNMYHYVMKITVFFFFFNENHSLTSTLSRTWSMVTSSYKGVWEEIVHIDDLNKSDPH